MIHKEDCKEGCCPAAQACWRCNVRGNSVGSTEQQITTGQQGRSHHYSIKHNKESIFPDLIVHD